MLFKKEDKEKINNRKKILTLRGLNHPTKGGKAYILVCERKKGGFALAKLSKPFIIDLSKYKSPTAKKLGYDKYLANMLGFESLEEYLKEEYNMSKGSNLRKAYFINLIEARE